MKVLVVGGSGGIGLAVVKLLLKNYPQADVIATYFTAEVALEHSRLTWIKLDVTNERAIAQLANQLGQIEMLINAVGLLHANGKLPEKSIKQFDTDFFELNVSLNTRPSLLLAKHFMSSFSAKNKSHFVVLSARIGSISDNRIGGWLSYRMSKAALNMAMKTLAIEWKRKLPNCCILLFHPGTTDTQFSKPFQKRLAKGQLHSPEVTATALLNLIQQSDANDSGRFVSFDGSEISW